MYIGFTSSLTTLVTDLILAFLLFKAFKSSLPHQATTFSPSVWLGSKISLGEVVAALKRKPRIRLVNRPITFPRTSLDSSMEQTLVELIRSPTFNLLRCPRADRQACIPANDLLNLSIIRADSTLILNMPHARLTRSLTLNLLSYYRVNR